MSLRLALVALIWLVILGGTSLFLRLETPPAVADIQQAQRAAGDFALEVTTTFDLAPDPFALTADDAAADAALDVSLDGERLFSAHELPAHEPQRIEALPALVQGVNEFLVQATPPQSGADASYAVRLRLLRGDVPLTEETFWSSGGAPVTGTLQVDLETTRKDHAE